MIDKILLITCKKLILFKSFSKISLAFCLNCMVLSFVVFKICEKRAFKILQKHKSFYKIFVFYLQISLSSCFF
ncbi:hypothetical protein FZH75_04895 [Campylobacter jejuni]|nr:hypothetical protein [Campylobacter jejuni]EAH9420996.1 hypothetical protein [Campylobacter jejuni]EAI5728681.1 hypothetical protein [Campylobacter jejuni]EAI6985531.1 hypothetical protein [Campylobacter jejuni]EAJ1336183.1 hypothetical protein [Campylobacter jejuni]